jgi:hypothetical protein
LRPAPVVVTAAACLAALPQLLGYAGHVRRGDYPGSAFRPRVDAMIEVSAVAARGGPLASLGGPERFNAVERFQADLGVPAVADALGRIRRAPIGERTLGAINLAFMCAALFGLVCVLPWPHRLGLVPVFLAVPLSSPVYLSADTPAIHGAFAVLAFVVPVLVLRWPRLAVGIAVGVALFVLHKFRSVYGLYALAAVLAVTAWTFLLRRDTRRLHGPAAALLVMVSLNLLWGLGLAARARDPRFAEDDAVGTHQFYEPLISGIGWTPNRWGIQPWDPKVAQFMADRLGVEPLPIHTKESEVRGRAVYLSLWREAPRHLMALYLRRIPKAFADHFFFGLAGVVVWAVAVSGALALGWRRREALHSALVLGSALLVICLVAQSVIIDPRLLYAYPLRVVSALSLATSLTALVILRARPR